MIFFWRYQMEIKSNIFRRRKKLRLDKGTSLLALSNCHKYLKNVLTRKLLILFMIVILPNVVLAIITITDLSGTEKSEFFVSETVLMKVDEISKYKISISYKEKLYYFTEDKTIV